MSFYGMSSFSEDREVSWRTIFVKLTAVVDLCYQVVRHTALRDRIRTKMEELDKRHPGFASVDHARVASFIGAQAALVFAYILDLVLVGVVAEYCAQQLFPNDALVAEAARYLVPLALIGVENAIALHRVEAERQGAGQITGVVIGWNTLGVLWAIVTPAIVLGAQIILHGNDHGTPWLGLEGLTYGLVFLSFALHLFVLLGGELNRQAQGYTLFTLHRLFLQIIRSWSESNAMEAKQKAVVCYVAFVILKEQHKARFEEEPPISVPQLVDAVLADKFLPEVPALHTATVPNVVSHTP